MCVIKPTPERILCFPFQPEFHSLFWAVTSGGKTNDLLICLWQSHFYSISRSKIHSFKNKHREPEKFFWAVQILDVICHTLSLITGGKTSTWKQTDASSQPTRAWILENTRFLFFMSCLLWDGENNLSSSGKFEAILEAI